MRKAALFLAVSALLLVPMTGSGLAVPASSVIGTQGMGVQQSGDNPLTTFVKLQGRIGVTVAALAFGGVADPSGTLTVTGVPSGATVTAAYLYLTDWPGDGTVSGTFESVPFGPTPAITTDEGGGYTLEGYRVDVTSLVTGNGSYDFTSSGISLGYVAALTVVYSKASLRANTIWINDGAEGLAGATSTTTFAAGLRSAGIDQRNGAGRLIILTQADDDADTGEVIYFNGEPVGGPIDANLGPFASLFDLNVDDVGKANTAAIETPADWFGWHLAILSKRRQ